MVKLPISDYAAAYYKEQGISFTFRQQAHLCWYLHDLLKEQMASLREILAVSDDEKLNTEIRERIAYEERAYACFMADSDPGCIYIVHPDDNGAYEEEYFASEGNAITYGVNHCEKEFSVEKRWLSDRNPEGASAENGDEDLGSENTVLSAYYYTAQGDIRYGISNEYRAPFNEEDPERFECMFLHIKSPFGMGDIVMGPGFDRPQVVHTDHDCFGKTYDRRKDSGKYIQPDCSDNRIRADYIGTDGEHYYEHTDPFVLWKVDFWEDEGYWEMLKKLSNEIKVDAHSEGLP